MTIPAVEKAPIAEPPDPITGPRRSQVVDIVKGMAIVLMVYGHTAQGMQHRGWWSGPAFDFSDTFVYSFHMPAFLIVSGLFLARSIDRRGLRVFVASKLETILYPYALWVVLGAAIAPLLGSAQPSAKPFEIGTFTQDLLSGAASWFLYTLFFLQILVGFTRKMPDWGRFVLGLLMAACVTQVGTPMPDRILQEFLFVAAGVWIGGRFRLGETLSTPATILGFSALAAFQIVSVIRWGTDSVPTATFLGFTGAAGLYLLALVVDRTGMAAFWAWLGRASLGIFLLAPYGQGLFREILEHLFHTQAVLPQLIVPTIAGVIIPAAIYHAQEKIRIGWLFRWPSREAQASV